ncbi:MAG: hypothetical protein UR99_C0034G0002 [Candidatus Moranbacteria bacterium GW2011_GWD2_36_12]|nr:MAG: hypothetical protein UR99_C0034G0002 [Candidatus Moranbacteria bacterium GW2011_GWD2_36_12]
MPNIGIHGLHPREFSQALKKRIDICMQKIGLDSDAITEIYDTNVESCNGKNMKMPYLRIFSPEFTLVLKILEGFSRCKIYVDVEIISSRILFFSKEEMESGAWREKVRNKEKKKGMVTVTISSSNWPKEKDDFLLFKSFLESKGCIWLEGSGAHLVTFPKK